MSHSPCFSEKSSHCIQIQLVQMCAKCLLETLEVWPKENYLQQAIVGKEELSKDILFLCSLKSQKQQMTRVLH
jgi:hypothetical protein